MALAAEDTRVALAAQGMHIALYIIIYEYIHEHNDGYGAQHPSRLSAAGYGAQRVSLPSFCFSVKRCLGESVLLTPSASAAAAKRQLAPLPTLTRLPQGLLTARLLQ